MPEYMIWTVVIFGLSQYLDARFIKAVVDGNTVSVSPKSLLPRILFTPIHVKPKVKWFYLGWWEKIIRGFDDMRSFFVFNKGAICCVQEGELVATHFFLSPIFDQHGFNYLFFGKNEDLNRCIFSVVYVSRQSRCE